jgi:hypothetical protein
LIRVKKSQGSSYLNLRYQTGLSVLIWPPPQKLRAIPKSAASKVVELNLGNQNRPQRMPLTIPVTELSSDLARLPACEPRRFDRILNCRRELLTLGGLEQGRPDEM